MGCRSSGYSGDVNVVNFPKEISPLHFNSLFVSEYFVFSHYNFVPFWLVEVTNLFLPSFTVLNRYSLRIPVLNIQIKVETSLHEI